MFESYRPTWTLTSIYKLNPQMLREQGISLVLTDLDNTLIAWDNPNSTPELEAWLKQMKEADIPVVVISNNNHKRVSNVAEPLGLPFIANAAKPFAKGIKEALERYHLQPEDAIMVGDQLMTDMKAAASANVRSVLVQPVVDNDSWKTKMNRFLESIIQRQLEKYQPFEWKEELS